MQHSASNITDTPQTDGPHAHEVTPQSARKTLLILSIVTAVLSLFGLLMAVDHYLKTRRANARTGDMELQSIGSPETEGTDVNGTGASDTGANDTEANDKDANDTDANDKDANDTSANVRSPEDKALC